MRRARLAALLALAAMVIATVPPPAAAGRIGPDIILELEPHREVAASSLTQSVGLSGNVTVDKVPLVPVTVYLFSTSDQGWNTNCGPNQFLFIDTTPVSFTCGVVIPSKTMNVTGTITVHAQCSGAGGTNLATINATITITGSVPMNDSPSQSMRPAGVRAGEYPLGTLLALVAVSLAIIIPAASIFIAARARGRKMAMRPPHPPRIDQ